MLWGDGSLGDDQNDAARVTAFKALTATPKYIIGFEEPDCSTPGSANMGIDASTSYPLYSVARIGECRGPYLGEVLTDR